jgi:hypothetical protein
MLTTIPEVIFDNPDKICFFEKAFFPEKLVFAKLPLSCSTTVDSAVFL